MTYPDTARAFAQTIAADSFAAAAKLPMSDWAEAHRHLANPQTIAANHALHVQSLARDLREALTISPNTKKVSVAARALLAAIGEEA